MKKLKSILGYLLAVLTMLIAIVTFPALDSVSRVLVDITGVQISPWFTGGEVAQTIKHERYETQIHRPVFDALIGERREGFVQVVWTPKGFLPETLTEAIDYDSDGSPDFSVTLHPKAKTAELQPLSPYALVLQGTYAIGDDGIGVRVTLKNKQ